MSLSYPYGKVMQLRIEFYREQWRQRCLTVDSQQPIQGAVRGSRSFPSVSCRATGWLPRSKLAGVMPKSLVECQAHYGGMRVHFSWNCVSFTGDNEPPDHWE
ncbi:Hypothetical protein SMAX5B_020753 [Scophthalmus maximus]|uniref:Uncharacterized protein n=1 Tax=Scophthalmus maximus TaxID=52904 RepID=A0A2U9CR64_SCOMX|nr:Hypothetical protein SMAX5B_020753 [Scophthalmus maximus]